MQKNTDTYFSLLKFMRAFFNRTKKGKINIGVAKEQKNSTLKWASQSLDLTPIENLSGYSKIAEHKHHPTNLNKQIWP